MSALPSCLSRKLLLLGILGVGLWGCDQASGGGGSTGGATSHAGGAGGTTGSGGTVSSGGTNGSGGSMGTGGAMGSGGSTAAGTGGKGTGGSTAMGTGGAAVGGTQGSGTGTGGTQGSGGAPGKGGTTGTGGAGSGGVSGPGGAIGRDGGPDVRTGTGGSMGTGGTTTGGGTGGSTGIGTCPSPILKSGDTTKKITVGTLSREYILHVPSAYKGDSAAPLVLDFHPIGGSDTQWRSGSPYPAVIDPEGVISAFPNGESGPGGQAWNVEGCCVASSIDDVAFAKAIVQDIEKIACIDAKRVYAVGFSMGGGMSNWLGCKAADVFAAVGPASFDLTTTNEPDCKPARPITVVEWRGKQDNLVCYAGCYSSVVSGMAITFIGAVATFQEWASLDGCTGSPGAADSNNCQTYSTCSAGVQVTLCTDNNGGHEAANAKIVWPMLKKYTLP